MALQLERLVKTYGKSEVIFRQNDPGKEMYIIYSGNIELFLEGGERGEAKLLTTLRRGDFLGEMAIIEGSPRSATAIAGEDHTQLIVLDRAKFIELLRQQPEFALIIMEKLCQRLREANANLAKASAAR